MHSLNVSAKHNSVYSLSDIMRFKLGFLLLAQTKKMHRMFQETAPSLVVFRQNDISSTS